MIKLPCKITFIIISSLACAAIGAFLLVQEINLYKQVDFSPVCFITHIGPCGIPKVQQLTTHFEVNTITGFCLMIAAFGIVWAGSRSDKSRLSDQIVGLDTLPTESDYGRRYSRRTILILAVVIVVLTGTIIFQQIQVSYLRPIAFQEAVTENSWVGFSILLYAYELGAQGNSPHGVAPSLVTVLINNASCASLDKECDGYGYSFTIVNVCQNTTYYGTCNFSGGIEIFWYDPFTNALLITGTNANLTKGQATTVYGNWPKSEISSLRVSTSLFFQVSTNGGWASSIVTINT